MTALGRGCVKTDCRGQSLEHSPKSVPQYASVQRQNSLCSRQLRMKVSSSRAELSFRTASAGSSRYRATPLRRLCAISGRWSHIGQPRFVARVCPPWDRYTMPSRLSEVKRWARALKRDVVALWIAARDPRTPWYAKVAAGVVAAYALSPIDLIPDFVPVLGYLDDIVIVPLGIALAVYLIPPGLMAEYRSEAMKRAGRPRSLVAGVVVGLIWAASLCAVGFWLYRAFR